jgi:uncharacterized protein
MRVVGLWRFPVKSLQGERIEEAELGAEGIEGDRRYAFFDVDTGYGLTARRAQGPGLARAPLIGTGEVR